MQLIEVSEIGVRAAIIRMSSPQHKLRWMIFPMVHLGSPRYYAEVERRMAECDLILAEGIDSAIVKRLTASYRLATNESAAVQERAGLPEGGPQHLHSDISGPDFDAAWRSLPFAMRVGVPLVAPMYGLWLRYFADREGFHKYLETNDLPSREEADAEALMPEVFDLILHRRDTHLLHQVDSVQQRWAGEERTAGVVWGAGHIGKVVHHLGETYGYIAHSADWVIVFDYTQDPARPSPHR